MSALLDLLREPYAAAATAVFAALAVAWILSLLKTDVSIVDIFWGPLFALAAFSAAFVSGGSPARRGLVLTLVSVWAARLALHVYFRNRGLGEDFRYRAMRERNGPKFAWTSLFTVFGLQGALLLFVAQPLLVAVASPRPADLGPWDVAGAAMFVCGLLFEAIGDEQLRRFKADPAHRGRVMDRGLWRFTRHPNYFGDALLWWGLYLIACSVPSGGWSFSGPLVMTILLLKVSGVALLEKTLVSTKPGYAAYVARTNAFFPWFPRPASR